MGREWDGSGMRWDGSGTGVGWDGMGYEDGSGSQQTPEGRADLPKTSAHASIKIAMRHGMGRLFM